MRSETIVVRSTEETIEAVRGAVVSQFERRVSELGPPPGRGRKIEAELTWFYEAMNVYDSIQVHIVGDGVGEDALVRTSILAGLYAAKQGIVSRCLELWEGRGEKVGENGRLTKEEIDSLYSSENSSHNEREGEMPVPKDKQKLFGKVIGKNLNEGKSKEVAKENAEKAVGMEPSVMVKKPKGGKKKG